MKFQKLKYSFQLFLQLYYKNVEYSAGRICKTKKFSIKSHRLQNAVELGFKYFHRKYETSSRNDRKKPN